MSTEKLNENERAIIVKIDGDNDLRSYLVTHGITVGTIFSKNYSPAYSGLINLTIGPKMINLRLQEFDKIEWVRI